MHSAIKMIVGISFIFLLSVPSLAAILIFPKENEQVYAGSWITVIVKPDPGEQWQGFVLGFKALEYDSFSKVYKTNIQVPNDVLGYRDDLRVLGVDKDGNEVELKRRVFVKLPPNVVLQKIVAGSKVVSGSTLVLLRKMPEGSSPTDIENYEKAELSVYGNYSDDVERDLTSSSSGTTYTSSDEKVATVDKEGKVTAQGIGKAKITVKNGKYSAMVDVIVKPYK